jgi:hypothetical protein
MFKVSERSYSSGGDDEGCGRFENAYNGVISSIYSGQTNL